MLVLSCFRSNLSIFDFKCSRPYLAVLFFCSLVPAIAPPMARASEPMPPFIMALNHFSTKDLAVVVVVVVAVERLSVFQSVSLSVAFALKQD